MSEADFGNRNIPVTTNLISALISRLFGTSIKAGKTKSEKKTTFLSDVSMSEWNLSPKFLVDSSAGH